MFIVASSTGSGVKVARRSGDKLAKWLRGRIKR